MRFLAVADPATRSTFGALFIAFNDMTQDMYILDEIYEKNTENTRVAVIGPRFDEKAYRWGNQWEAIYDPAEPWFAVNVRDHCRLEWVPAKKVPDSQDHGFSQIKDLYFAGKMHVHKSVVWLHEEVTKYKKIKNKQGNYRFPNVDDHLIDCLRYAVTWLDVDVKPQKDSSRVLRMRPTRDQKLKAMFGIEEPKDEEEPDMWDPFGETLDADLFSM